MVNKLTVFICGFSIMVLELAGNRIISPILGNTIYSWAGLMAMIMLALTLGYYYGGKRADKKTDAKALIKIIGLATVYIALIPIISPGVLLFCSYLKSSFAPIVASMILFVPPGIFLAMVSPYVIKLEAQKVDNIGTLSGTLSSLASVGSILGTFITGIVLVPYLGVENIFYLISAVLAILVIIRSKGKQAYYALSLLLILIPNSIPEEIIYKHDGPYNQVSVIDYKGLRRLTLNGIEQGGAVVINNFGILGNEDRVTPYQEYFKIGGLMNTNNKDCLIVGLGSGYGVKAMKKAYPDMNIDIVEIDEAVVNASKKYFSLSESDYRDIYVCDGRMFFTKNNIKYDMIVLDAYGTAAPPFQLTTTEAFNEMSNRLNPNGIIIINYVGALKGENSRLFQCLSKTLEDNFKSVLLFPKRFEDSQLSDPEMVKNIIIIASNSKVPTKEELITSANKSLESEDKKEELSTIIEQYSFLDKYSLNDGFILTDQYAPVENLSSKIEELVRSGSSYVSLIKEKKE
jgi:spermidine synthase